VLPTLRKTFSPVRRKNSAAEKKNKIKKIIRILRTFNLKELPLKVKKWVAQLSG
jgi:hypothetical protein